MIKPNPEWAVDEKANYRRIVRHGKELLKNCRGEEAIEGIAWTAIQNMHNADKADDCRRLVMQREKELLADLAYTITTYAGLIGCSLEEIVKLGEKRCVERMR